MDELESRLEDYLGALNEIRSGLHTKLPEKPPELGIFEMIQHMNIPLVQGGLMDQPHIWLRQYGIVNKVKSAFDAIRLAKELNRNRPGGSDGI